LLSFGGAPSFAALCTRAPALHTELQAGPSVSKFAGSGQEVSKRFYSLSAIAEVERTTATQHFGPAYDRFGSFASIWAPMRVRLSPNFGHIGPLWHSSRSARTGPMLQQKASYSITSLAPADSPRGTSRPSALAVLRLMISSIFVTCCTGRSAGLSPLRMRPV
jgi:hypothetical protein